MKEIGLLMKAEMVNATLEERKNQTRRPVTFHNSTTGGIVKRKDWHELRWSEAWLDVNGPSPAGNPGPYWHVPFRDIVVRVYPRVQPQDVLWVRETFLPKMYPPFDKTGGCLYKANGDETPYGKPWKPSIHMPRWACRLDLDVLKVRSERVQVVSEKDAWSEGCIKGAPTDNGGYFPAEQLIKPGDYIGWDDARDWFADLWDSINASRGFPWEDNHPVWVYDFKRIDA